MSVHALSPRPHPSHTTPTSPEPDMLEVILDRPDLAALVRAGSHPATLVCGRCGTSQGRHRPTAACPRFLRPDLPPGYVYADRLVVGQYFRFVPLTDPECLRQVEDLACCAAGKLTVIRSRARGCEPATHWLDGSLVVASDDRWA